MRKLSFANLVKWMLALALVVSVLGSTTATYAAEIGTNPDTGYQYIIDDRANLLDTYDNQYGLLLEEMSKLTEYTNVIFVSTDDVDYSYYSQLASTTADQYFGSTSVNTIVFSIDMKGRELYFYATGDVSYKPFNSSTCSTICDNIYTYASKGDYLACAYKAFEQAYKLLHGDGIARPMKFISNALLALIFALFINFFVVKIGSAKRKASSAEIMNGIFRQAKVNNASSHFVNQTKKYSPQSSGGSGGGGGGGHSGGGGGGGHSSGGGHHF